jgi:hypothetical protein
MDFYRKLDIVLEQKIPPKKEGDTKVKLDYNFDEDLFSKMANFIVNLDPDSLSDEQLDFVIDFINDLEVQTGEEIQEVSNPRMAKITNPTKNAASKKWYRQNRLHVKKRKKKFYRSAEGRKRLKKKERMERMGKTATGRRKVRYHVRQRDKDKNKEEKK